MSRYRVIWRRPSADFLTIGALCATWGAGLFLIFVVYMLWYPDHSPDSPLGYLFAIMGTGLLVLVGVGYPFRKRIARKVNVRLHTYLLWHIGLGILALGFILAHSVGNTNARSGTYALWGLIALVLSGFVGKGLDRICPKLAAQAALTTLTHDGDDTITVLATQVTTLKLQAVSAATSTAYGRIPHTTDADILAPRVNEARARARTISRALDREMFFLYLIRAWRVIHTLLAVITLGLIIWHLVYAATLLF